MKKLLIVLLAFGSISAFADSTVVINGLKWSRVLGGHYQNLDLDGTKPINRIIQKSQATKKCKALGNQWHLPTKEEFETLGNDYKKLPGIFDYTWLWSSTYEINVSPNAAYFLGGGFGQVNVQYRGDSLEVVCVSSRKILGEIL